MPLLTCGYAQAIITPTLDRPVYLAGFGKNRRALTVHDDLYVRALAFADGEQRVVLAVTDLLGLIRLDCQAVEEAVNAHAPGTPLILACTHTHHGPDTIGFWGPDEATSGVDGAYMVWLKAQIVTTALAALEQLAPVAVRTATVAVTGVAKNARDPAILDQELTCLQCCDPLSGQPRTTFLIYPCHPEVLWNDNPHITADYLDALRRGVEAATGAPCLAAVGALGGMMTPDMGEHTFAAADRMGAILAAVALPALAAAPPQSAPGLGYRRQSYTIPSQNPLFDLAVTTGLLADQRSASGEIVTEAGLLQVGDLWICHVPGELLPALGLRFKAELRAARAGHAAILGLANDELGYILPEETYRYPANMFAPGDHYEETMSVGPEAGPRLAVALQALLATG